jgi:hypothetical protein
MRPQLRYYAGIVVLVFAGFTFLAASRLATGLGPITLVNQIPSLILAILGIWLVRGAARQ